MNFEEVNILGNIINDTYGKASTSSGGYPHSGDATVAIKKSLENNVLKIMAISVINTIDEYHMRTEVDKCEDQLNQHIDKELARIKKEFKGEAGRALKAKQIKDSEQTSVEIINHSAYNAKRSAYVRRFVHFEIE